MKVRSPLLACAALLLAACGEPTPPAELRVAGGDATRGKAVIVQYGCGACHVIPGVPGAVAWVGPPLMEWSRRSYIAGRLPNAPAHLAAFLRNPDAASPGTAMPALGLSEAEARDAAAFLYTLGRAQQVPAGQPMAEGEAGTLPEPRIRPRRDALAEPRPRGQ
jgi:cytochrome c2